MAEKLAGKNKTIEDCCPDLLYAKLLASLKDVFNHDDFKSKLQEQAVRKVATGKYFLGTAVTPPIGFIIFWSGACYFH